jgi:signal transduction histidine kinase
MAPGKYTFRVVAANSYGIWNNQGASVGFVLDPHYYESHWFHAAVAACFCALLWALHEYRLRRLAHQYSLRLEERVNERTRIARELHDTLLQDIQGALFQLCAARNLLSRNPEQAQSTLNEAITNTSKAIAEARDSIQGLRGAAGEPCALEDSLKTTGNELAAAIPGAAKIPAFTVTVAGATRALAPVVRDELYRIGRELLANAFQHAHGEHIQAEIRYDRHQFCVRIRDDGIGIDKSVLATGARAGHWGLPGIRERAKRIGAQLDIWSESGAGTKIDIRVPAGVAYAKRKTTRRFGLFRKRGEVSS